MNNPDPTSWIGSSETVADGLDPTLVGRVAATLSEPAPKAGEPLPPLWQWAFFIQATPMDGLGKDGHPARGGFLPPADDRNRMWAGGRVDFHAPLRVGVPAERRSTVIDIKEKAGRTGALTFVTVRHEYWQDGAMAISEEQDIVYRQPTPPKLEGTEAAPGSAWREKIDPTPTLLFRYSAVTFNGHRIHYDAPYATGVEGYPALVVHGPFSAVKLAMLAARQGTLARFEFRAQAPLFAGQPVRLVRTEESEFHALRCDGAVAMIAKASYR